MSKFLVFVNEHGQCVRVTKHNMDGKIILVQSIVDRVDNYDQLPRITTDRGVASLAGELEDGD